ncbi:nitroreductase [Burkholderiales bacterium JOSHI_001]|nr:nitroreductase [Burkholderiales bacterium JOSHI_001]
MNHPLARDAEPDWSDLALALINSRYSVAPKRLQAPGPSEEQLLQLVQAAASAPDHRALRPWRVVRIADHQRMALADVFEVIAGDRTPPPTPDDIQKSRAKALRAPMLLLLVLRLQPEDDEVPEQERCISAGAAMMNLLLAAHAMGYAGMLTSGRSIRTERFARAFALGPDERALCFVSLGTPDDVRTRPRPSPNELLSDWAGPPAR